MGGNEASGIGVTPRALAVQRVLRGEDVSVVARDAGVPDAILRDWCDRFVRAGTAAVSELNAPRTSDVEPGPSREELLTRTSRAEDALGASEARYRLLVEHAPVAIYVHDGKNVLFANHQFANVMGAADPQALVGYPIVEIAHPDERPKVLERVRRVAAGLIVSPGMEFRVMRLDGGVTPVLVMATKCEYAGHPAIQVVMIDETERLRARAEHDALETQLWHAQRVEALGTLAAGIAHDFNNMLAVIWTNAELARTALAPDHAARLCIDELLVAAARAGELVRGILAVSRKQPLERKPVRLADIVGEVARFARATFPPTVGIEVDLGASRPKVSADSTQVHQALMNLCTNAWHAASTDRPARIRIAVTTVALDAAGARAHPGLRAGRYECVSVRDNGLGMDASTMAHVFDPFFTTKSAGLGTGLGLSVVQGIMTAHGGAVEASSELGAGSEFRLYFPHAEAPDSTNAGAGAAPQPVLDGHRVLLVDDEKTVLSVVSRALEAIGLRVTARATLDEALATLIEEPGAYDLIMADHKMPGGSGLELAKAAKRLRAELPLILMSGYLQDDDEAHAEEHGVCVLLAKPFSIDELKGAVHQALASRPATTPAVRLTP